MPHRPKNSTGEAQQAIKQIGRNESRQASN
jgi:hypothetical protein